MRPNSIAGDRVCNDCLIKSLTHMRPASLGPFLATMLSQSPQDGQDRVRAAAGQTVPFEFDVRFSETFDPLHFVLRPETTASIARFSDHPVDFYGAASPSDRHIGVFTGLLRVPSDTPAGTYPLQWGAVRLGTGQVGNLAPRLVLIASPAQDAGGGTASPPSNNPPQEPPTTNPPTQRTYSETTGGVTNTWTNYTTAGGTQGPSIPSNTTVEIACKITGFRVADGDTWWYRISSSPWNGTYYSSADAFYNNGQTSGSLHGTPFVDSTVPDC
jgi:hypothetical protein